jgi:hypothetical protein
MGSCESKTINDAEIVVDTTRPGWLRVLVLLVVDEEEVYRVIRIGSKLQSSPFGKTA